MAELEFHVGDVHGHDVAALSGSGHGGRGGLAEREEFRVATEMRLIPEAQDDRNNTLRPARFFPAPVNWKNAIRNTPVEQNPRLTRIYLSHIGLQALNRKVSFIISFHYMGLLIYLLFDRLWTTLMTDPAEV